MELMYKTLKQRKKIELKQLTVSPYLIFSLVYIVGWDFLSYSFSDGPL